MPESLLVFIAPPSWPELERRLASRATESEDEQARRLATARTELAAQGEFDAVVINEDVAKCAQQVLDLMQG